MNTLFMTLALLASMNSPFEAIPETEVPQSLGVQTKTHSCSTEDLEQIRDLGATFIRRGFYWNSIEKEKGVYNFSEYDRLLRDADSNGLRVLGCLYGGNTLYEDDGQGGIQTETGRKGFANFSAALAEHYKGCGIIWEIWNEPNTRTFWRQNGEHNSDEFAAEYTALVKETVAAMHAADSACFVVAGSVSCLWEPSFSWINACFEMGMLQTGINGWSVHPYGFKTPEEHVAGYARVREILADHGVSEDFPLLNSERGFSLNELEEGWSGGEMDKAAGYQAWHFVRQYLLDLMCGIHLSIWYEWSGDDFGLIQAEEKRPAYHACVNMVKQLYGYTFSKRLNTSSPLDYLLLFENETGGRKLVAWTAPPAKETPNKAVIHSVEIPLVEIDTIRTQP